MFDIGFWEVALIGIVTLLVVGPDRLPEVARTAGRWVLKIRRFVAGVKSDFNRELQTGDLHKILGDQKEQINELRSMVDSTRRELESSTSDAVAAAKSKLESVEELGRTALSEKPSASASSSASATSTAARSAAATAAGGTVIAQGSNSQDPEQEAEESEDDPETSSRQTQGGETDSNASNDAAGGSSTSAVNSSTDL